MALQHAQLDHSGKVLPWLLREANHRTPAMAILLPDGRMATSQLAINDAFRTYYQRLYERPVDLNTERACGFLKGVNLPKLTDTQGNIIEEPIQLDEIAAAVKQMARENSEEDDVPGMASEIESKVESSCGDDSDRLGSAAQNADPLHDLIKDCPELKNDKMGQGSML
ncbi:hypothetical protein NDU88_003561 [Pleurodeles waltl]|uniref:Uncharacterized protein n=1 Tax=Pleurodeles waltl TaxID=8319 RepID=A0AAV7WV64_PLEWA|nr:hypothetical protein NDU88_003561 [Pleurodeles waltl]